MARPRREPDAADLIRDAGGLFLGRNIADLDAEIDQQRTRAEAAEAELRTAREVIATMEETQRLADESRDNLEAANRHLRERIDSALSETRDLRALLQPISHREDHCRSIGIACVVGYSDIDPLRATSLRIIGALTGELPTGKGQGRP